MIVIEYPERLLLALMFILLRILFMIWDVIGIILNFLANNHVLLFFLSGFMFLTGIVLDLVEARGKRKSGTERTAGDH
jgi:hypothetical protein